ncbi:hypothetical protein Bca52824_061899 [Brassica carinata]|uniref:PGG domain-containing protein n=1 Tax=Brassica carinata TaxID=52824 RepID=A0A8X7U6R9_BRACI|nr:hypothetical protein Bca52824_061899 [Brassica carinata]
MDPRLQQAAESGSIDELYDLIDENPYLLENIDAVPFVTTPLHVAASSGNIPFAMEMLNLKPSFARKLNTSGYSPLHLAVDKDKAKFVGRMLLLDKGLVRVKGRNGITPFLLLVSRGKADLVAECLLNSPECIQDETVDRQNALHLAVVHDRFEVLQVLTGWIQRMSQRDADSIEKRMLRLLLECRSVERNKVNGNDLTFLDILRSQGPRVVGEDLDLEEVVANTGCKEAASLPKSKAMLDILKSPLTFSTFGSTFMRRQRSSTSDEARGVFLIVCTLIITATYQTALQPPGGVQKPEDTANASSEAMKKSFFMFLWASNTVGFSCAIFYTFCLIPISNKFVRWFFWIGGSLCISYALAMAVSSPDLLFFLFATLLFFLLVALCMLHVVSIHFEEHRTAAPEPRLSWFWKD